MVGIIVWTLQQPITTLECEGTKLQPEPFMYGRRTPIFFFFVNIFFSLMLVNGT